MSRTYAVTLEWPEADRERQTIAVDAGETVLEAAERADVFLPYGCRTGACGTCTGRLLSVGGTGTASRSGRDDAAHSSDAEADTDAGETTDIANAFEYRRPPRALKERHRAAGYVLLCIAVPRTDCRIAVGSSVQAELVENPWK